MEVCIIGGGFSGVISSKLCKDRGLVPFILNKTPSPGGLWKGVPNEIGVWDSLHANAMKYIFSFSDHLWNEEDPDYPSASQVCTYLDEYIDKHSLLQYFNFDCKVTGLSKHGEDYIVNWTQGGETREKVFKYVILATGRCSREISHFENTDIFKGVLIKGGEYRNPSVFEGKNVVCVGRGFTSSDIALEASNTAAKVTQIWRKNMLIIKKYLHEVPFEVALYSTKGLQSNYSIVSPPEYSQSIAKFLVGLFGNPSEVLPEWGIPENTTEQYKVIVCGQDYLSAISSKKITAVQGTVESFYENGVVLSDGSRIEAEVVVLGTGYVADYGYLSDEIKQTLQYEENNSFMSTVMYRSIMHPSLPRLCFVGNYLTGYPGRFELNAEAGIRYLLGELNVTEEELWQGVRDEEYIRQNLKERGNPYGYSEFLKEMIRILGIQIDYQWIKTEFEYENGPFLPQMLWLDRPGQVELARTAILELKRRFPFYQFN